MEDKHTPGPWKVEKLHAAGYHKCFTNFVYWIKSGNDYICFTQFDHPRDENKRIEEELRANAKLIARAPDLLRENHELKEKINELIENRDYIWEERKEVKQKLFALEAENKRLNK